DRAAAQAAIEALALGSLSSRDVLSLSGGERQGGGPGARPPPAGRPPPLCRDAPLLLLDEPLAHLDLHHQIDCLSTLVSWMKAAPRTIVFSCHDLNLARRFATHALLMDGEGA